MPGAQWDELHGLWERWDERSGSWKPVGDAADPRRPSPPDPLPAILARELQHEAELDAEEEADHIIDIDRIALPERPVPGAQWNEVVGRWEVWSEAAGAWEEARS